MWYYIEDGRQAGPVEPGALAGLIASGTITPYTQVWRQGMGAWQPAGQTELTALFLQSRAYASLPPPLPPTVKASNPLAVAGIVFAAVGFLLPVAHIDLALSLIGLLLSIIGISGNRPQRNLAIMGIALGAAGVIFALGLLLFYPGFYDNPWGPGLWDFDY